MQILLVAENHPLETRNVCKTAWVT
jgi:hypothetical protein